MFGRSVRRVAGTVLATGGILVATAVASSAHDCFIASRSAQGDAMAGANSQAWYTLVVNDAIEGDALAGVITQAQADCIMTAYAATGAPSSFTIHVKGANGSDGVIADKNPNTALFSNGKGVDHAFEAYGQQIFGSYAACGVTF